MLPGGAEAIYIYSNASVTEPYIVEMSLILSKFESVAYIGDWVFSSGVAL